jgi:uncharacterized UBP type Zn finger protein
VRGTSVEEYITKILSGEVQLSVPCRHVSGIQMVTPAAAEGCQECLKMGDRWVHLRLCLTCGHVGCCNNSKNRHASKHFDETGHPLILSFEPGEPWLWCYEDEEVIWPEE